MEYRLKNMSWSEFDKRRKNSKTVIIPSGACEVYGPHLPLGSDILVADKVSELVAKEVNGIVAPCVEVGQSKALMDFPGTIAISADHLAAVYRDMAEAFIHWGFKSFFILNTHLHNTIPLVEVFEDLKVKYGIKYAYVGWWQFIPALSNDLWKSPTPHTHASEAGTSVMLHLYPELVDMSKAVNTPNKFKDDCPTVGKGLGYSEFSDSGTLGDATIGTAEKGKIIVERGVSEIVKCIKGYLEK